MLSQSVASGSLFDWVLQDKGGRRVGAFLQKMDEIVPWEEISDELDGALYDRRLGRPGFPVHVLVKALLLQSWYGLSDPELEEQVLDRVSFQRFLGVRNRSDIPDETTICRFRGKLTALHAEHELFEVVQGMIDAYGLRVNRGTIVDATIVDAPKGRKREDGTTTRDKDAGFTKKNGKTYHGYKAHVGSDTKGRFIEEVIVTSATTPDNEAFDDLVRHETKAVFADKAYVDQEKKRDFRQRNVFWGVLDRASRGHPLSTKQRQDNHQKSSVRSRGEHPFAWMKRAMRFAGSRFRGLRQNTFHITLVCTAYNLKRLVSILALA